MRRNTIWLLAFMLVMCCSMYAQSSFTTEGTAFWVTWMRNSTYEASSSELKLQLVLSAKQASNVQLTNPRTGWSTTATVAANNVTTLTIPANQGYNFQSETIANTAIYLTANNPISVYASNYVHHTFDATNVLPVSALSTQYMVQAYATQGSGVTEFAVVATEDNTTLTIAPSGIVQGRYSLACYTKTLQRGQVYQALCPYVKQSLAGSLITADKPIAVFQGDVQTYIPDTFCCSDHMVEQAIPVRYWGKEFALTRSYSQSFDRIMLTAATDNTVLRLNGQTIATLQTGESHLLDLKDASAYLQASHPVACYLYMSSRYANSSGKGDPSMVVMTPLEQAVQQITFATYETEISHNHYLNIVVPTSATASMKMDGIALTGFKTLAGNAQYSYLATAIPHGTHTLTNATEGFIAHVYGIGVDESYAYSVGGTMKTINTIDLQTAIESRIITRHIDQCDGRTFRINGNVYDQPGTYTDTTEGVIYRYILSSHAPFYQTDTIYLATGQSVQWHQQQISAPGIYFDNHRSTFTCDSNYTAYVLNANQVLTYDTLCAATWYKFRGVSYPLPEVTNDPLDYTITDVSDNKEYVAQLRLMPAVTRHTISYELQPNETMMFNHRTIHQAGVYTDTLISRYGCDSIVTLTVTQPVASQLNYRMCEGETYTFGGRDYNATGIYYDTTIVHTEKRVNRLVLTVDPVYNFVFEDTICQGDVYSQHGFHESTTGVYTHALHSIYGCDSTATLRLTVCVPKDTFIHAVICRGEKYTENGFRLSREGTYTRSIPSSCGCDSTITVQLDIAPHYYFQSDTMVESHSSFTWRGIAIDSVGTYTKSYSSQFGCDSIYSLRVRWQANTIDTYVKMCFAPATYDFMGHTFTIPDIDESLLPYDYVLEVRDEANCQRYRCLLHIIGGNKHHDDYYELLPDERIVWESITISRAGDYTENLVGQYDCDSIVTLHVTQPIAHLEEIYDTICAGDNYSFGQKLLNKPGTYSDTTLLDGGSLSVQTLHLTVSPTYHFTIDRIIETGQSYHDANFNKSATGTYTRSYTSSLGCDSTYTLHLLVCEPEVYWLTDTILEGQVYTQHGIVTDRAGVYDHTMKKTNGCDSIVTVELTVLPLIPPVKVFDTICEGDYLTWEGEVFASSVVYPKTFHLKDGRDSVRMLHLTVLPQRQDTICATIREGETYSQLGFNESQTGTYTRTYMQSSCEQSITLQLQVLQAVHREIYDTICSGENYVNFDTEMSAGGTYVFNYLTSDGRDSTITLHLTELSPSQTYTAAEILRGESYSWHGQTYQSSIFTVDTLVNAVGCDSICVLNLMVTPPVTDDPVQYTMLDVTICEGETYLLNGQSLTEAGYYQATLTAASGYDSVVNLTLRTLAWPMADFELGTFCADDSLLQLRFTDIIEGGMHYQLLFDTLARTQGFVSTATLPLESDAIGVTLPHKPAGSYIMPNHYTAQLVLSNEHCASQRTYPVSFTVLYPSWIIHPKWTDVIGVMNQGYNGGYQFSAYQWYKDSAPIEGATSEVLYQPSGLSTGDYQALVTRASDDVTILTCAYHYEAAPRSVPYRASVAPTMLEHHHPIVSIDVNQPSTYRITNAVGVETASGILNEGTTSVILPGTLTSGVYMVQCESNNGQRYITKILIK